MLILLLNQYYAGSTFTDIFQAMLSGPGQFAENETNEVHTIRPLPFGYYTISRLTSVRSQAMSFRKFACISLSRPGIIASWPKYILNLISRIITPIFIQLN